MMTPAWRVIDLKHFIDRLSEEQLQKRVHISIETWEDAPAVRITMTEQEMLIEG